MVPGNQAAASLFPLILQDGQTPSPLDESHPLHPVQGKRFSSLGHYEGTCSGKLPLGVRSSGVRETRRFAGRDVYFFVFGGAGRVNILLSGIRGKRRSKYCAEGKWVLDYRRKGKWILGDRRRRKWILGDRCQGKWVLGDRCLGFGF